MDKTSPQSKINPFETGDLRNYFRVNSVVKLRTCPVTPQQIKADAWPQTLHKSPAMQLMEALRTIEQESSATLRAIAEQNKTIEQYLRTTNKRIELIASYLSNVDQESTSNKEQKVLISEAGIEFAVNNLTDIKMGECLALEIILTLSHASLSIYGKVINVREGKGKYIVGVEFIEVKDAERQLLAKHVIQQQMQDKREAKA